MEHAWPVKRETRSWIFYVSVAASLIAIAVVLGAVFGGSSHIEDINGDDTSLAVITMEEILSDTHRSTTLMSSRRTSGSSTGVRGHLSECDVQSLSFSCKKCSGVRTFHATMVESGTLLLHVKAEVLSGNLELVITVDGEYYCHVPIGKRHVIRIEDAAGKLVELRVAAESAQIELDVSRVFLVD